MARHPPHAELQKIARFDELARGSADASGAGAAGGEVVAEEEAEVVARRVVDDAVLVVEALDDDDSRLVPSSNAPFSPDSAFLGELHDVFGEVKQSHGFEIRPQP